MSAWSETIKLPAPLRDAFAVGLPAGAASLDASQREAWQAGYQQGRIDGEKSLSEQLVRQRGELHELMQGTIISLRQAVPQVIRDTENIMVSLALEVARKIGLATCPSRCRWWRRPFATRSSHVESSAHVTVRLHPADLELLQNAGSPLAGFGPRGKTIFAS